MLGLKLNHVSKSGPVCFRGTTMKRHVYTEKDATLKRDNYRPVSIFIVILKLYETVLITQMGRQIKSSKNCDSDHLQLCLMISYFSFSAWQINLVKDMYYPIDGNTILWGFLVNNYAKHGCLRDVCA